MSEAIITVEGLGKKYSIRHQSGERYTALRDVIADKVKRLFGRRNGRDSNFSFGLSNSKEDFWALKNVSFEVKRGEVLGIIGRNGAGKSTLLKILSRITEPTEGRVRVKGRVASLLEVGTGFHPELTGRENIYLNGAVLGMARTEIQRKFDEIVAFAETEKFLDTPVKRYSSGMYVRLAFAVAAHLEPEILVVDEVLAVGDAAFQAKCLGKMQDVSTKEGRTVLFVSHNLAAVRQLCTHGLLLEEGKVAMNNTANAVADRYLQEMLVPKRDHFRTDDTGYTKMRLVSSGGATVTSVFPEQNTFVELELRITCESNVQCGFTIFNQMDVPIVLCASEHGGVDLRNGDSTFRVRLPSELLQPGTYRIEGAVWDAEHVFQQDDYLCHFQVMPVGSRELHGRRSSAQFVSREPWICVS